MEVKWNDFEVHFFVQLVGDSAIRIVVRGLFGWLDASKLPSIGGKERRILFRIEALQLFGFSANNGCLRSELMIVGQSTFFVLSYALLVLCSPSKT